MQVISLTNSKYSKLKLMDLDKSIYNTEGKIYNYHYKGEDKVLKELYEKESSNLANKLYTLEMLNECQEILPSNFCIPDNLMVVGGKIIGFTLPKINGINLKMLLNDVKTDSMDQLYYLKRVGEILRQMDYLRKNPNLANLFLNDLHESNFMVNPDNGEISVIDLDSCKIGKETFFSSRFLSPMALLNNVKGKYKILDKDKSNYTRAYVDADRNTDLYCYGMMILEYLSKDSHINNFSLEQFYNYLNYLESIGININLLDCFNALVSNAENKNPSDYLEGITYKQLFQARESEFKKKLSK